MSRLFLFRFRVEHAGAEQTQCPQRSSRSLSGTPYGKCSSPCKSFLPLHVFVEPGRAARHTIAPRPFFDNRLSHSPRRVKTYFNLFFTLLRNFGLYKTSDQFAAFSMDSSAFFMYHSSFILLFTDIPFSRIFRIVCHKPNRYTRFYALPAALFDIKPTRKQRRAAGPSPDSSPVFWIFYDSTGTSWPSAPIFITSSSAPPTTS